jgi:SAM-dependent methyltransferase
MAAGAEFHSTMQLPCPACGKSTEHRALFVKNGCAILQCSACGLGRAEATSFDPGRYYTGDYFSGRRPDGYADYVSTESVLRREFARTVQFIRKRRPAGRLLEIGCAYGFFLQEAAAFYDIQGLEISEDAAAFCRQRGLPVLTGVADEAAFAKLGRFDVIVLLDVIEHLPDPARTLALCGRHLDREGVIVITTGDFASLYARLSGRNWRLMTPPQHLWYFTPKSMARLSASVGLGGGVCDHPWKLVPISLISFQLARMLGMRPTMPAGSRIGIPVNLFDAMRCLLTKAPA